AQGHRGLELGPGHLAIVVGVDGGEFLVIECTAANQRRRIGRGRRERWLGQLHELQPAQRAVLVGVELVERLHAIGDELRAGDDAGLGPVLGPGGGPAGGEGGTGVARGGGGWVLKACHSCGVILPLLSRSIFLNSATATVRISAWSMKPSLLVSISWKRLVSAS